MMWDWHGYGFWSWLLMALGMIAFWGVVLLAIFLVLRANRDDRTDAEAILAVRFARGEIDAAEYEQRLRVLRRDIRTRAP